jgi:hypothetical protein
MTTSADQSNQLANCNIDGQSLVNAQCEVNRAVFLMNARHNRNQHPYTLMDDDSFKVEKLAKLISNAIEDLKKAQQSLPGQGEMFA